MPSLGAVLAALNVNSSPFSLLEAARRLDISPPSLSKVIKAIQQPLPASADLFPEYFPEELPATLSALSETFEFKDIHKPSGSSGPDPAVINSARKRIHNILKGPLPPALASLYLNIRQRKELDNARSSLADLENTPSIPNFNALTKDEIKLAQIRSPVAFVTFGKLDPEGNPIEIPGVLKGYKGSEINTDGFLQLQEFAAGRREKRFRLRLWEGEIEMGAKQPSKAISSYRRCSQDVVPVDPRRRLANLRLGFAHLALGDQFYQSARVLNTQTGHDAAEQYNLAISAAAKAPFENPQTLEIENYAHTRLEGLQAGLNFLGLSNHYLPENPGFADSLGGSRPGRFSQARTSVENAIRLRDRFEKYLAAAKDARLAKDEAAAAAREAKDRLGILERQTQDAEKQARFAATRFEANEERIRANQVKQYTDIVAKSGELILGGGIPILAIPGLVSFAFDKQATFKELSLQEQENRLALELARSQQLIATIEENIARDRSDFLDQRESLLTNNRFNVDIYYAIALAYERLLEQQLVDAYRKVFFAERRAVYELGVKGSGVPQVDFAFPRRDVDLIVEPERLLAYLDDKLQPFFSNNSEGRTQFNFVISLRNRFPLEFGIFLETGRTLFEVSLADLDREDEGVTSKRIRKARVTIDGIGEQVVNLRGHLRHYGTFLLRDPQRTILSSTLLPTDAEIEQAIEAAKKGFGAVIGAGGVTFWQTSPATMSLSSASGDDSTINELEHYGFAGLWEFQFLPEDNPKIDFSRIADVIIDLRGEALQKTVEPDIEGKVRELLEKFRQDELGDELLDRATVLSLEKKLPDILEQLKQGSASLEITSSLLGVDIANAQLKAVLFRATDESREGIPGLQLKVSKPDSAFVLDKATQEDGFSENLGNGMPSLPLAERFPLAGNWQIEAPEPAQLNKLNDLALFFLYTP